VSPAETHPIRSEPLKVPFRYVSALAILPLLYCNAYAQGASPFFVPPTHPGTGQVVTADFNGDGKPDLIFSDGTVLLGKGDGTFTVGTPLGLAGLNSGTPIATADPGKLGQEAADACGHDFAGCGDRDQALEQAEVGVNGDVLIGDFDGAFDGCAEQAHLRG
jgi:hypothetical protein